MRKIIFMGDILYHSLEYLNESSMWVLKMIYPMIENATNETILTFDITNQNNELFDRNYFFKLGNTKAKYKYQDYNVDTFKKEQIEYLKNFFNNETIVIGFELYEPFIKLLTQLNVTVIDFAFHSYKLFDDLTFAIATNNENIHNQLLNYQIHRDKFEYYTNYWKIFMKQNNMIKDFDIKDNSCLFIGQTMTDKSVDKNGVFLNVTHFEEKLKELSQKYSQIYYLPHPALGRKRKYIYNFINKSPYIKLLKNRSTYGLLASDKIKKVIGISTSVLYEAQYFGKEIEYLYKPLFNIDTSFQTLSYVSILDDYYNPRFWADVLSSVCDVKKEVKNINYFKNSNNKIRNIYDLYWGYEELDPIKRLPLLKTLWKKFYYKYIASLF